MIGGSSIGQHAVGEFITDAPPPLVFDFVSRADLPAGSQNGRGAWMELGANLLWDDGSEILWDDGTNIGGEV